MVRCRLKRNCKRSQNLPEYRMISLNENAIHWFAFCWSFAMLFCAEFTRVVNIVIKVSINNGGITYHYFSDKSFWCLISFVMSNTFRVIIFLCLTLDVWMMSTNFVGSISRSNFRFSCLCSKVNHFEIIIFSISQLNSDEIATRMTISQLPSHGDGLTVTLDDRHACSF